MEDTYLEHLLSFAASSMAALQTSQGLIERHRKTGESLAPATLDALDSALKRANASLLVVVTNLDLVVDSESPSDNMIPARPPK